PDASSHRWFLSAVGTPRQVTQERGNPLPVSIEARPAEGWRGAGICCRACPPTSLRRNHPVFGRTCGKCHPPAEKAPSISPLSFYWSPSLLRRRRKRLR